MVEWNPTAIYSLNVVCFWCVVAFLWQVYDITSTGPPNCYGLVPAITWSSYGFYHESDEASFEVIVYNLWRERNTRIFRGTSMTPHAFFQVIDWAMRDTLLSFPSASASSPSLLQFYFCYISPYS